MRRCAIPGACRNCFGNRVFGPEEPHVSRIQSLYIRKIMLKIETEASMRKVKTILRNVYEEFMVEKSLRSMIVYYDVDPNVKNNRLCHGFAINSGRGDISNKSFLIINVTVRGGSVVGQIFRL